MIRAIALFLFSIAAALLGVEANIKGEMISLVWLGGSILSTFLGYFTLEGWLLKNEDRLAGFPEI